MKCTNCLTIRCDDHEFAVIVGWNEKRWRALWLAWVAAFAVAETAAIRSGDPHAPLSHHARKALRASDHWAGSLVILGGAAWLTHHLFRKGNESARSLSA